MMKKVVVLASMATVAAVLVAGVAGFGANNTPAVYASRLAGIQGAGGSGIQITINIGTDDGVDRGWKGVLLDPELCAAGV